MLGKTKCYMHGGKTPVGFALPHTKTGKYSKHLPTRLLSTYEETLNDPKLWELNEKAALVNARIAELVSKLDTGETGETWQELRKAYAVLQKAIAEENGVKIAQMLGVIGNLIEAGNKDYLAWAEITGQIEAYRKLSESERKHQDDMSRMITAEQLMLMISAITDVIRQNVSDRQVLSAISMGIDRMITVSVEK